MGPSCRIESLGVYLPEKVLSTEELLASCRHRPRLNLARVTGIRERRVAVGEFAVDLGVQAAQKALALSRYAAEDIDLLICTSISKYHREHEVTFEPATSVLVRKALGAKNALNFDLVNACAGMFNGIHVADAYLRSGAARTALVVSGECNRPLAESATREILTSFDGQLAALTLGDGGAAVVLDRREEPESGFHCLDLVTGAKHNHYCYSIPSPRGPGGILVTKARGLQKKGAEHFPTYLMRALERTGWTLEEIDCGIAHQVSVRGVRDGVRAVQRFVGREFPDPFVYNCDRYGNTTTTSHFVVLDEFLRNGHIQPGHKLLFVSGASGIVITHATYTMDELATRYRNGAPDPSARGPA